jgi:hypothetical protein
MATAGYNMKFGKGYLGGSKEPDAGKPAGEMHEPEPEEGDEGIKAHLEQMHAKTGTAHSHVHHHGDGNHTMHHISAEGEHSGPEEGGDCPGGMCGGGM